MQHIHVRTSGLGCGGGSLGLWRPCRGFRRLWRGAPLEEWVLQSVLRLDALVGVQRQHLLQQVHQRLQGRKGAFQRSRQSGGEASLHVRVQLQHLLQQVR